MLISMTMNCRPAAGGFRLHSVAIVSPFSSGRLLPREFKTRGWRSIAVLAEPPLDIQRTKFRPAEFDRLIAHSGDISDTARQLERECVAAVLTGDDTGVALADTLASLLHVPGNDPETSANRRDKWAMIRTVHEAGIRVPSAFRATTLSSAIEWASDNGWPVVLKPLDSCGSDGVAICKGPSELSVSFQKLHYAINRMGSINKSLLIQEYMDGEQYHCNTVSVDGAHRVTEVWHDMKKSDGHYKLYDRHDLLEPDDARFDEIVQYTFSVLDALGVRFGPAHTETMYDVGGPCLIETAARLEGMYCPSAVRAATGQDQVQMTAEAVTGAAGFHNARSSYQMLSNATQVFLIAPAAGVIRAEGIRGLLARPTVHWVPESLIPSKPVVRTIDLFTTPGNVYLVGMRDEVTADYLAIRNLERGALYELC